MSEVAETLLKVFDNWDYYEMMEAEVVVDHENGVFAFAVSRDDEEIVLGARGDKVFIDRNKERLVVGRNGKFASYKGVEGVSSIENVDISLGVQSDG